eukprot:TRINITY_DN19234_c0_g1_i1.p1 TRINITY_DN19234_c0_g1~~TRINITY_DN19234_c0_g1_i1.p1  ORF type:complete len:139 (+),score=9.41 TRINITY_DN19234_c0_g1_i1:16-432(+)
MLWVCLLIAVVAVWSSDVDRVNVGIKYKPDECTRQAEVDDVVHVALRITSKDGTTEYLPHTSLSFRLGVGEVIPGLDQGLVGACITEHRKLVVPPSLAYKDQGMRTVPPNAVLAIEVELNSIEGFVQTWEEQRAEPTW